MSAEIPPDPITTSFNPAAWNVPELTDEERALLDANYIKFPIAQNNTITFPTAPIAPTLSTGTNTTQVATTGFVQNAITAFKAASNVWSGIQTFSLGITTATISAISGTLTLTGTTIANNATFSGTTTLSNPFTPGYSYPIAAANIGQIVSYGGPFTAITFTANTPLQIASMTGFTPGTWVMTATLNRGVTTTGVYFSAAISTTSADVTSANALGIEYATGQGSLGLTTSISCIVQVTSSSTVYYVNAQTGSGGSTTITPGNWRSIRVA
jgi:hypothetical protein